MKKGVFDLSQFDEYREGNRLEVKKANAGLPNSLWDTYSSFSNCNGGAIILGVREREDGSWHTTHLQNKDKLLKDFWNTVNNRKKVSVNLLKEEDVKTYEIEGDIIIVIYVSKADRVYKPVYINNDLFGGTFRRDHEGDYHCSEAEVRGMLRDQAEKGTDNKILLNMDLGIFNSETVRSFRSRHTAVNPNHVWHKLDDIAYLERIGAASISDVDGKLHPTAAGLLMFGEEYKIRSEFPDYFLDYREMLDPSIRWTDRLESSSGEWSGNLLDFFFQMERKLLKDLKKPFRLEGITRIDETPVHKAIREALANCIANADFNFPRGIVILKNPDSIVIENPGSIITGKAQMLKGGVSEPRNKIVMKMFNLIRIGERAGSGVPDIFSVWESEGWAEPVVEELYRPDRTVLKLSFIDKSNEFEQKSAIGYEKPANGRAKPAIETPKSAIESLKSAIEQGIPSNESPKSAAGAKKIAFESIAAAVQGLNCNEPTINNIGKIYSSVEANQIFGAGDVKAILNCSDSTARAVIAKLRDDVKAIVPVKGHGKGKYRFVNFDEK